MIKQPLVSGQVSSVNLSKPLQRGFGNERALRLEGIFSKTMPNHSVFLLFPIHHGDVSESNVCHGIPRRPLDPTTNWRLLSCHLLSLPDLEFCIGSLNSFLKKCRVGVLQHGTCHGIYSGLLKLMTHNGWKQVKQE